MKFLNKFRFSFLVVSFVFLSVLAVDNVITPRLVYAAHLRVSLSNADSFAILAGSAITDTGTSSIIGDVGLSPTGGASITGLTCTEVSGTIYDTDAGYTGGGGGNTACLTTNPTLLTAAKNDLTTAYTDAAGRTVSATVPTELGGTTLTDGTYDSASGTFGLTGTLTLDGQGNVDAVFIFKMATTLITASSSRVVLTNGAQACNVYWQVGSSATLGTSSVLVGNVLALTSITDNGASIINGRLLARNGAVTLNNTTITRQTCAPGTTGGSPAVAAASSGGSGPAGSNPGPPSVFCPAISSTIVAPTILESRRVDEDSIYISWGPYSGVDKFNVRYGNENGVWSYNTDVTGFSTTINNLPKNQPIWVQVAGRNECMLGTYGMAKLVGGPALPSTGFNPDGKSSPISKFMISVLEVVSQVLFFGDIRS